jgi:predicted dehydrogenase
MEEWMETVKLGIIGIGNMGSGHARSLMEGQVPELVLTAVADLREMRRQWARENLPADVRIFEDGDALIESGCCDAVLVATPHYDHPRLVISALSHGLHAMCEKPAGVYTKQVREMNEAAQKSDRVFAMMFNQRTNHVYRKMHEIVHGGEYGKIKRVNWIVTDWYRTQSYYDSGSWRATWKGEGGGVLLNQCPHNLDLLQWICGLPCKVQAFCHEGKWHDIEVEDDVTAYLEFPEGATGVFVTSTGDAPGTNRLELTLEYGKLVYEEDRLTLHRLAENERDFCKTAKGGFDKPQYTVETVDIYGEYPQHAGVMNAFAACILHGTPLVAQGTEGIRGLTLSNAMHLSSWLGRAVALPFDEDLFLSELEKRCASSQEKQARDVVFDTKGTY